MSRPAQIWVSPNFKKFLKTSASKEGLTMLDFTEKIAKKSKKDKIEDLSDFWGRIV